MTGRLPETDSHQSHSVEGVSILVIYTSDALGPIGHGNKRVSLIWIIEMKYVTSWPGELLNVTILSMEAT